MENIWKRLISQRLRQLRGPYSFEVAAAKAGVSAAQWCNWENLKNAPTPRSVRKIALAYNVDPEWILEGEGRGPKIRRTVVVSELEEPYGGLEQADKKTLEEVEDLLRHADDDVKRSLRSHVKLLCRVPQASKKRASGED